jgi:alkanesulfonate monooxygenase SsuD/methylene tetrahydromethanopterin reductase-like flavin-dependent oxidoreductase (luciferase family)
MRTVARHADAWNTAGDVETLRGRLAVLDEHLAEAGRDRSDIELTVSFPTFIRDTVEAAVKVRREAMAFNGIPDPEDVPLLVGPPDVIAATYRPYLELGFSTVIARLPAPFDRETIDRLPEVLALLD